MKNTFLSSIIEDSFDRMFIRDKRGKLVFYPWGDNKQGYFIKSRSLAANIKKFYKLSLLICFVIFAIAASIFHRNFWAIIGSIFVSFGGWYLIYYLYITKIVKSLPVAELGYSETILEKIESDNDEESSQVAIQFPVHRNQPVPEKKWNGFMRIQHIWYRLSPGQIYMVCIFIAIFIGLLWSNYRPEQWVNADYLIGFLICLLLGYGAFVIVQHMKSTGVGWFEFKQIRLAMVITMIAGWSFAAWFLYQFLTLIIAQR